MKSLLPPPPPVPLGRASDVLPRPLGPIAEEVEAPEPAEFDGEPEDVAGVLPPVAPPPRRLVAALNAADAFGADVERVAVELEELELEEEEGEDVVLAVPELGVEPRPRSARLPRKRGVRSDT